ncbi:DoxX family protein [Streptomyces mirabilis]|uniref:DoxX family protein n=1 Tax=Streptomyces mirabilis TaxID=68239 RepID=UPI0036ACA198
MTRVCLRHRAERAARRCRAGRRTAQSPSQGQHPSPAAVSGRPQRPLARFIGLAELAAAAGLLAGLFWQPIGVAAALGFAVVLVGAIGFHVKSGDYANPETRGNAMAPAILTIVAIAAAVTLVLAS